MKKLFLLLFFLSLSTIQAQDYFPIDSGVKITKEDVVAFTDHFEQLSKEWGEEFKPSEGLINKSRGFSPIVFLLMTFP